MCSFVALCPRPTVRNLRPRNLFKVPIISPVRIMTLDRMDDGPGAGAGASAAAQYHRHPKRLIFAPGDIAAPPASAEAPSMPQGSDTPLSSIPTHVYSVDDPVASGASTPVANEAVVAHPSRAHQFGTNPPLSISHINTSNPLHQFHSWFRDPRLPASSAPETCTLATASMPSGRVSARVVYLKELDERGWVVYSNWGSKAGKGGQVFGSETTGTGFGGLEETSATNSGPQDDDPNSHQQGNRWAALTFHWPTVERQVRVEGLIESLSRNESETYWRTRERGSQIGAWASQQSKILWSMEADGSSSQGANPQPGDAKEDASQLDDGRSVLENRVKEMTDRFASTEEIPLPPFWGGIRVVPESVEFWQGRKSRLHDRFRYVRVHDKNEKKEDEENEKTFKWRIQRLSP